MRVLLTTLFAFAVSIATAQDFSLNYVTEIETQGPPLAIAADTDGGVYYTVFSFAGENQTRAFYVEDPLAEPAADTHMLVSDAADTIVPAGRGFTGVAVDPDGFVYLALEAGSGDEANVRKLNPAPDFSPTEEFGVIFAGVRYNGIDVLNNNVIAVSTFNSVEFWDAENSAPIHTVGGLEAFQRDVAYNPLNDDIYVSKNGGEVTNSVNLLTGGTPATPTDYEIQNGFIPQGGVDTAFGSNGQLIEFDAENNLIMVPDFSNDQSALAFYSPDDTSAPVLTIDGTESPNGGFDTPSDSVAFTNSEGETLVFVTDNGNGRIVVYTTAEDTQVSNWNLF